MSSYEELKDFYDIDSYDSSHPNPRLTAGLQISAERYMQAWTNTPIDTRAKGYEHMLKKRIEDERRECVETAG